jgi:hypothetical protein
MRKALDSIKKIPHPEEAAKQLSRRTHVADLQLNPNSFTSAGAGMTMAAGIRGLANPQTSIGFYRCEREFPYLAAFCHTKS